MSAAERFDLARFVTAQAPVYEQALAEIRAGRKTSHWMWFVFPQLAVLGRSATARHYGIGSLAEAQAYLAHPLLGARLRECTGAVTALPRTTAERVFGAVDALKLRSSMTLFLEAGGGPAFGAVLAQWYGGQPDGLTLQALAGPARKAQSAEP